MGSGKIREALLGLVFETGPSQEKGTPVERQQVSPIPLDLKKDSPVIDSDTEKFVLMFREAIEKDGGIGAKFSKMLYELSRNPGPEDYNKALNLLKIMDSSLSAASIIDSLSQCEDMISNQKVLYVKQGNERRSKLEEQRDEEKNELSRRISSIESAITSLEKELAGQKSELDECKSNLASIDKKYLPELDGITQKMNAVSSASDTVLSSIVQVKTGITNNLK